MAGSWWNILVIHLHINGKYCKLLYFENTLCFVQKKGQLKVTQLKHVIPTPLLLQELYFINRGSKFNREPVSFLSQAILCRHPHTENPIKPTFVVSTHADDCFSTHHAESTNLHLSYKRLAASSLQHCHHVLLTGNQQWLWGLQQPSS